LAKSLLINGEIFDKKGYCYLGVFNHDGDNETFYAGQSFLEQYYVSFNAEPSYKDPNNKLLIGIGEINPYADLAKRNYDPDYNGYRP